MKSLSERTRDELAEIIEEICDILWRDPVTGRFDPERSWNSETIEWIADVLEEEGLKPDQQSDDRKCPT